MNIIFNVNQVTDIKYLAIFFLPTTLVLITDTFLDLRNVADWQKDQQCCFLRVFWLWTMHAFIDFEETLIVKQVSELFIVYTCTLWGWTINYYTTSLKHSLTVNET